MLRTLAARIQPLKEMDIGAQSLALVCRGCVGEASHCCVEELPGSAPEFRFDRFVAESRRDSGTGQDGPGDRELARWYCRPVRIDVGVSIGYCGVPEGLVAE